MKRLLTILAISLIPITVAHTEPVKVNAELAKLTTKISETYKKEPSYVLRIVEAADNAAKFMSLPRDIILGMIHTESRFDHLAVSHKGAKGLMQVTSQSGVMPLEWSDPEQNVYAGATLLNDYRNRFGLHKAIESYNAGPGKKAVQYRRKVLAASKEFVI